MTKQVRYAESGSVNAVTVVDYIVERLAAEGISHCFGVAGDYLFPICDAVDSSSKMKCCLLYTSRLRETPFYVTQLVGFPSPFLLWPAALKVANQQPAERLAVMSFGIIWLDGDRTVVTPQRLVKPL